ncbi:MAG: hypothetical protein WD039_09470 [Xanthobacteraceae bacterium]
MRKTAAPRRYHQLMDGEWIAPRRRGFREQCCDCALVHVIDYRINAAGQIEFRARRDRRATAAARKVFKFTKETD